MRNDVHNTEAVQDSDRAVRGGEGEVASDRRHADSGRRGGVAALRGGRLASLGLVTSTIAATTLGLAAPADASGGLRVHGSITSFCAMDATRVGLSIYNDGPRKRRVEVTTNEGAFRVRIIPGVTSAPKFAIDRTTRVTIRTLSGRRVASSVVTDAC